MRSVLLIPLLFGCSEVRIVVGHETNGCADYDPDNPPDEQLVVQEADLSMLVYRDGVEETCDSHSIQIWSWRTTGFVREFWTEGVADCSVCFNPTIIIKDPDPGTYEVEWYLGDNTVPFDNVEFEVD